MTTTASTWTEAITLSEPVTQAEAVRRLKVDDNPKVYRYRKTARIAMDLMVHGENTRWVFVGFEYCNRNGYGETGVANFRDYSLTRCERTGDGWTPTVFQSDVFGYFHVDEEAAAARDQEAQARIDAGRRQLAAQGVNLTRSGVGRHRP